MKRILLTSTALVMVAGIAAADGHASMSWSGTATAGVAREGRPSKQPLRNSNSAQTAALLQRRASALFTADTFAAGCEQLASCTARCCANNRAQSSAQNVLQLAAYECKLLQLADATAQLTLMEPLRLLRQTAGNFRAYSEVNATVTGTVTAGGMTLSAGMSVDAGDGYDFADDDDFDTAQHGRRS